MSFPIDALQLEAARVAERKSVINRIRSTIIVSEREPIKLGRRDGRKWASNYATYDELRRLDEARNSERYRGDTWDTVFVTFAKDHPDLSDEEGVEGMFQFLICDPATGDGHFPQEFWAEHGLGDDVCPEYIQGFADGALDLWDEISRDI